MDPVKFVYYFDCVNCATPFTFEHKSDSIETATCPVCKQDRQMPKDVKKVEQVVRVQNNV